MTDWAVKKKKLKEDRERSEPYIVHGTCEGEKVLWWTSTFTAELNAIKCLKKNIKELKVLQTSRGTY